MASNILIEEVSRLVSEITGVQLGQRQAAMVESRLTRRMIQLGFSKPEEYLKHLQEHSDTEVTALVSLLTTHHTNFFREFSHFEYLTRHGLPNIVAELRKRGQKVLNVWSAACSRGHEVYSLSMFLTHHLKELAPEMTFRIHGSDVDPESVSIAKNGVYRWEEIKSIPSIYLGTHWARGTGEIAEFVKAKDSIKGPCSFDVVNLLDFSKEMAGKKYELIFCRNVFIYFTPEQIKATTNSLLKHLSPEGLLFIGISESLNGMELPVTYLAPSIYAQKGAKPAAEATPAPKAATAPAPASTTSAGPPAMPSVQLVTGPLKVLCVDDSATILSLLKKILTPEAGFEIVATAANGVQAAEMLRKHKVDIMTLDIHMPVQTGIEYLEKNYGPSHPPVVMLTSVSREDAALGVRSLQLGAVDYIEKPSLSDLSKRSDEIRMKLRYAVTFAKEKGAAASVIDLAKSFQRTHTISAPEKKLRIMVGGMGDRVKLINVLKCFTGTQPATVIFLQGHEAFLEPLAKSIEWDTGLPVKVLANANDPVQPGTVYLADFAKHFGSFRSLHTSKQASLLIFGDVACESADSIGQWPQAEFLVEDLGAATQQCHQKLAGHSRRLVPYTSFAYHSIEYLSRGTP